MDLLIPDTPFVSETDSAFVFSYAVYYSHQLESSVLVLKPFETGNAPTSFFNTSHLLLAEIGEQAGGAVDYPMLLVEDLSAMFEEPGAEVECVFPTAMRGDGTTTRCNAFTREEWEALLWEA